MNYRVRTKRGSVNAGFLVQANDGESKAINGFMFFFTDIVVVFCHTSRIVMGRFMFMAQDRNMTYGDYVFFTMASIPVAETKQPWINYNTTGQDLDHRIKALYAMKQVL